MVDIDPIELQARGQSPADSNKRGQRLESARCPRRSFAKIGDTQYTVGTNADAHDNRRSQQHPDQVINGRSRSSLGMSGRCTTAGRSSRTSSARTAGASVLLGDIKISNASTVAVVNRVRKVRRDRARVGTPGLSINELFDQSKLVTTSITGALREGGIAARPHRAPCDPAVPRQVALDPDRPDLDSPVDPDIDRRPLLHGRHTQRLRRSRRHGAGSRHIGRRFDGDDSRTPTGCAAKA